MLCPTYRYARLIPGINLALLIPHTCQIHPNWVGSSGIRNGPTHRKSDRERLRKIHWGVYRGCKILADRLHRTRMDTTRLSLCQFDWAEADREILRKIHWSVYRGKCWRIDSVGHGRTRPVSLCVGSTEQSPFARDLEKYTEVFTEDLKCSQGYSIGHGPSFRVSTWLTRTPMFLNREFTILNVTELIVVSHKWEPQSQLRWL